MVFGRRLTNPLNQLWKFTNNKSIIVFVDPRKTCNTRKKMEHKYADRFEHFEERNHLRLCSMESSHKARTRYKRVQSSCYNFLERPNGILSVSYHFALFGLVVVGLVFVILETMSELKNSQGLELATFILEVFLLIVFSAEYILRMWSAGCRSTYSGLLGRVRFAFKPFVIVDLVVIASTSGVLLHSRDQSFSILRFFQVLRMVRFDRQGGSWKLLGSVLFLHKQELLTTVYIGFCSLIFASFFVYQAENAENEEFNTFADSFWWGVVTLTTVGYGDKVPKSWAGRGVAAFFAIMGISFFALPAGILGSGFALKVSQQQRQKHVKRRRRPAAMLIQCNWRYYASQKKLTATWLPYVKYLQENNSKKHDHSSEKPIQPAARVRRISIFGRKASGISSEGLYKPNDNSLAEQGRRRSRKGMRSELFQSNDSLHDGHSCSTADQHTDDEHVSSIVRKKPILVTDACGNVSLPSAYKQSIRFTRYLKFLVALRKFKLAKKPYDVKDVIEQYTTGHVEVLGKVRNIGNKIDEALGYKVGTEKVNENPSGRTNVVHRLSKLEKQVKTLETKLDRVIGLLEEGKRQRQPLVPPLSEEQQFCANCGNSYEYSQQSGRRSSEELQENKSSQECKKPTRRRKIGASNQNLNRVSLSERQEQVANDERPTGFLQSEPNCGNNNSLQVETDGHNYLSPHYGDGDGEAYLSRQSSVYGISDNCPSPIPSSSDESYNSKDDDRFSQNILSPDGTLALYGEGYQDHHDSQIPSAGMHPLFGQSYSGEHSTVVDRFTSPEHELYGGASNDTPLQYGASNKGYEGNSPGSTGDHISPNHGYISGEHFSTDFSTSTSPSLYGCNQLLDSRIHDSDHDHSTVMVPPPSSVSSQPGDTSTGTNQSPERTIPWLNYHPPSEPDQDPPSSNGDGTDESNDDESERKIFLEERPLLQHGNSGPECNVGSDGGEGERLAGENLSQTQSCFTPVRRQPDLQKDGAQRTSGAHYPERETKCDVDENYRSRSQSEHARTDGACFSVDKKRSRPCDEVHASDSEESNRDALDRPCENDVTVVISRTTDDLQETRM